MSLYPHSLKEHHFYERPYIDCYNQLSRLCAR